MVTRLLRFEDLKELGIARSWPQVRRRIDNDGMPPGQRLGAFRVWREEEIEAWLKSLPERKTPTGRPTTTPIKTREQRMKEAV